MNERVCIKKNFCSHYDEQSVVCNLYPARCPYNSEVVTEELEDLEED